MNTNKALNKKIAALLKELQKTKNTDKKEKRKLSLNNPLRPTSSEVAALFVKDEQDGIVRFEAKQTPAVAHDREWYSGALAYRVADIMKLPKLNEGELDASRTQVETIHPLKNEPMKLNAVIRFYYEACDRK